MTQVKINKTNWEVAEINECELKGTDLTFWSFFGTYKIIQYKKRCCTSHDVKHY